MELLVAANVRNARSSNKIQHQKYTLLHSTSIDPRQGAAGVDAQEMEL
ncbi:hypothetical protein CCACVL1_18568 [Corchorus capsularis]|uniref:Uncharacterized protein n=1 Tax=Corchorus capsularis TaxID=210143 RepID=A0A1R3HKZ6_COCAP|nr:hypothetical protein CCACVL1_18568 [Corchorus capsularis]